MSFESTSWRVEAPALRACPDNRIHPPGAIGKRWMWAREVLVGVGMTPITSILVPIDFCPASDAAVERAVVLAAALDAELTILHVYEIPIYAYPGAPFIPVVDLSSELEKSARLGVATVVHQLESRVARVSGMVRQGSAWREINEAARETGADLIIVGTHGRRGVARAFLGSVAEKVVRTSPVPVLTVHPTKPTADHPLTAR